MLVAQQNRETLGAKRGEYYVDLRMHCVSIWLLAPLGPSGWGSDREKGGPNIEKADRFHKENVRKNTLNNSTIRKLVWLRPHFVKHSLTVTNFVETKDRYRKGMLHKAGRSV